MDTREKLVKQAISHFWYGVSHDIFNEPVTTYAKLAIDALEKENGVTVQEWISVKDRLPEPTYCVLVVGAYSEMAIDALGTDGEWMGMVEDITHWMPLPKPPKEE